MVTFQNILEIIINKIEQSNSLRPLIMGIDGPDCSGKTTMSLALLRILKSKYTVQVFHCDDYVNPIVDSIDVNTCSPNTFYEGFFDRQAILKSILEPIHSLKSKTCKFSNIIIVEGLFLGAEEFEKYFDLLIRLEIDEAEVLKRALLRDVGKLGDFDWVKKHYQNQCIPAQNHYRENSNVHSNADCIFTFIRQNLYSIGK